MATTAEPPASDPLRWKALFLLCAAQFIVILDTSIIGVALPTIQNALGFTPEGPVVDLQRLCDRLRRIAAARRPVERSVRPPPDFHAWFCDPHGGVPPDRPRAFPGGVDRGAGAPGARGRPDRPRRAHHCDEPLRRESARVGEGARLLGCSRCGWRNGWRVPRWRDHGVDELALDLSHQRAARSGGARLQPGTAPSGVGAAGNGGLCRCAVGDGRAGPRRLRDRDRRRSRVGVGANPRPACCRSGAVRRLHHHPAAPAGAARAAGHLSRPESVGRECGHGVAGGCVDPALVLPSTCICSRCSATLRSAAVWHCSR